MRIGIGRYSTVHHTAQILLRDRRTYRHVFCFLIWLNFHCRDIRLTCKNTAPDTWRTAAPRPPPPPPPYLLNRRSCAPSLSALSAPPPYRRYRCRRRSRRRATRTWWAACSRTTWRRWRWWCAATASRQWRRANYSDTSAPTMAFYPGWVSLYSHGISRGTVFSR